MRRSRTNFLVRYAVLIVLLGLFSLLVGQLLVVIFGSELLFETLVVVLLIAGVVLLIRTYRRVSGP